MPRHWADQPFPKARFPPVSPFIDRKNTGNVGEGGTEPAVVAVLRAGGDEVVVKAAVAESYITRP